MADKNTTATATATSKAEHSPKSLARLELLKSIGFDVDTLADATDGQIESVTDKTVGQYQIGTFGDMHDPDRKLANKLVEHIAKDCRKGIKGVVGGQMLSRIIDDTIKQAETSLQNIVDEAKAQIKALEVAKACPSATVSFHGQTMSAPMFASIMIGVNAGGELRKAALRKPAS